MFDTLVKIIEVVFKPLFETSKDALQKSTDPKRKMTRALIKLYDDLDSVQYWSEKLLTDSEVYISKTWVAWTVAKSKREQLIKSSDELRKSTLELGKSLNKLYSMLSIHNQELLAPLVGIYGHKGMLIAEGFATPEIINISDDPNIGSLKLLEPNFSFDNNSIAALRNTVLNAGFRYNPNELKKNYLREIDIDGNKEQIAKLIEESRPVLTQIDQTKALLREFIQKNVSIEDFFK